MKYEVYAKVTMSISPNYLYILSTDNFNVVSNYIKNFPDSNYYEYIILDNCSKVRLTRNGSVFTSAASYDELYDFIYACKLSKLFYENELSCFSDHQHTLEEIIVSAKYQTEFYLENYNKSN